MNTFELYKEHVDLGYIEDDLDLHVFNLKNRIDTPKELVQLFNSYETVRNELKITLRNYGIVVS